MKSTKKSAILVTVFCTTMHVPAMEPKKIPTTGKNKYEYTVSAKDKKSLDATLQDLQSTITVLDEMLKNPSLYEEKKIINAEEQKKIAIKAIAFIRAMSNGEIPVDWDRIKDLMRNLKAYPV